jgi:hypothetical protein
VEVIDEGFLSFMDNNVSVSGRDLEEVWEVSFCGDGEVAVEEEDSVGGGHGHGHASVCFQLLVAMYVYVKIKRFYTSSCIYQHVFVFLLTPNNKSLVQQIDFICELM